MKFCLIPLFFFYFLKNTYSLLRALSLPSSNYFMRNKNKDTVYFLPSKNACIFALGLFLSLNK